jgi:hypothetical protein
VAAAVCEKTKTENSQHLKTNKENHVSRFIRGISSTSQGLFESRRFDCARCIAEWSFICGFCLLIN